MKGRGFWQLGLVLSVVFAFSFVAHAASEEDKQVALYVNSPMVLIEDKQTFIDPQDLSVTPVVIQDLTYVPVRFVSEAFDAVVGWDEATKTASIQSGKLVIQMTIGKNEMVLNGASVSMEAAAQMVLGKTYIPLRALSGALGKEVFYDRGLIVIGSQKNVLSMKEDKSRIDALIAKLNNLPTFKNKEDFEALLETVTGHKEMDYRVEFQEEESLESDSNMKQAAPAPTGAPANESATGNDYSSTNVQVFGVDEADVIKTDGEYIYYINRDVVHIVSAVPAVHMMVESEIKYKEEDYFSPRELYIDGDKMVVIGTVDKETSRYGGVYFETFTRAYVYDITKRSNPRKEREIDTQGYYVSSRKVDDSIYFITNVNYYELMYDKEVHAPGVRDTAVSNEYKKVGFDQIYYFPKLTSANFTMITGFELNKPKVEAVVSTYFGSGENIYVSRENMYVATRETSYAIQPLASAREKIASTAPRFTPTTESTVIYKFSLYNGAVTYLNKQTVPGLVLNQFSMDEDNGYFRIATTSQDENYKQSNNLYVLNDTMNIVGTLEKIAPEERIYSTRFMGDRAYMVTFKNVDPLFAIDLQDPKNPKILGALKIPGYSNYLHPYDETHLIGFGKDTFEEYGTAYYDGMKISFFDVTDIENPVEMFTEIIGGRGTHSPLLENHKALLFSKEKNLLAFPLEIYDGADKNDRWGQGYFEFQGVYAYKIDLDRGFVFRGSIRHLSDSDLQKAGMYSADGDKFIDRVIYIGDALYTVSNAMVKANNMNDMTEMGSVSLK